MLRYRMEGDEMVGEELAEVSVKIRCGCYSYVICNILKIREVTPPCPIRALVSK